MGFYKCSSNLTIALPKKRESYISTFKKRIQCACYRILTISWCNGRGAILVLCNICAKRCVNEGTINIINWLRKDDMIFLVHPCTCYILRWNIWKTCRGRCKASRTGGGLRGTVRCIFLPPHTWQGAPPSTRSGRLYKVTKLAAIPLCLSMMVAYLHLSLLARVSGVEYPPLSPAPSARMSSSSGVAPPVISDRINVNAFWLKYVWNTEGVHNTSQLERER